MGHQLTPEKARQRQEESFAALKDGDLFQLTAWLLCLAVRKVSQKEWEVIRLNRANRAKIIAGEAPEKTLLHFNDMEGGVYIQPELDE